MKAAVHRSTIELRRGDITESETDAIVNAANSQLILGAGVAGAIRAKGGPRIQQECNAIGGCPVGGAVITSGGNLRARHVIHAVGPRMGDGDEHAKLRSATLASLRIAEQHRLDSVAFPAISTGIFGFPLDDCARIMLETAWEFLERGTRLREVLFVLFNDDGFAAFRSALENLAREKSPRK